MYRDTLLQEVMAPSTVAVAVRTAPTLCGRCRGLGAPRNEMCSVGGGELNGVRDAATVLITSLKFDGN